MVSPFIGQTCLVMPNSGGALALTNAGRAALGGCCGTYEAARKFKHSRRKKARSAKAGLD